MALLEVKCKRLQGIIWQQEHRDWGGGAKLFVQANKWWIKYHREPLRREEKCIMLYTLTELCCYSDPGNAFWDRSRLSRYGSQRIVLKCRELSLRAKAAKNVPCENLSVTSTIWHRHRNEHFCLFPSHIMLTSSTNLSLSWRRRALFFYKEEILCLTKGALHCSAESLRVLRKGRGGEWEAPPFTRGQAPIQVLLVSCWKLLCFLMQPPPKWPWHPCQQNGCMVLNSPVILLNGHSF